MYSTLVEYAIIGAKHKIEIIKNKIKNCTDKKQINKLKIQLEKEKEILNDIQLCEKEKYKVVKLFHTKPRKKMFLREYKITLEEDKIPLLEAYLLDIERNKVIKLFFKGDNWEKYNQTKYKDAE